MKKIISLILSIILIVSISSVSYAAANFEVSVDKTEVEVGETVTVTFDALTMNMQSFAVSVGWNKANFECTSIEWSDESTIGMYVLEEMYTASTLTEANNTGYVGVAGGTGKDKKLTGGSMCTIVLKAIAAGENTAITLTEETAGQNAFECKDATVASVTVKSAAPQLDESITGDDEDGTPVEADKTKTWTVTVGKDLVGQALKATLTNSAAADDNKTQEVNLTFADDVQGGVSLIFNVEVKFIDFANAATTTLKIEKAAN